MRQLLSYVLLDCIVFATSANLRRRSNAPLPIDFASRDVNAEAGEAFQDIPSEGTPRTALQTQVDNILLGDDALTAQQEAFDFGGHLPEVQGQESLDTQNSHAQSAERVRSENPYDKLDRNEQSLALNFGIVFAEVLLCALLHCSAFTALVPLFKKVGPHVLIGLIAFIVIIALMILTWSEVYWFFDPESKALYLDTVGTMFVLEIATTAILTPIIYNQFRVNAEAQMKKDSTKSHPIVTKTKSLRVDIDDMQSFALLVTRGLFNAMVIIKAKTNLPPRDPHERMNGATYCVVLWEYLYLFIHVICIVGSTVGYIGVGNSVPRGVYVKLVVHNLQQISGASFLQAFPFSHPMAIFDDFTWHKLMNLTTISKILNIPIGVLGLLVKVNQLSFIGMVDMNDWTVGHHVQLLAFINNLAGVIPKSSHQGIKGIFQALDTEKAAEIEAHFMNTICEKLSQEKGSLGAMMKYWNLQAGDLDLQHIGDGTKTSDAPDQQNESKSATKDSDTIQQKQRLCC
jgi:hypothetical protein